jgi:hypothetical protein
MTTVIDQHKERLENHPLLIGDSIQTIEHLRLFMEHHVFAVWDFMSLAKALQHRICPSSDLWMPTRLQRTSGRLINDIILHEESDNDPFSNGYTSHFDLYCQAMVEVGANTSTINTFLDHVAKNGLNWALNNIAIPAASRDFMRYTFGVIERGNAHEIAAAFTHGRETVIPQMFGRLVGQLNLNCLEVPRFSYYLDRHIEVDGDEHGPASMLLIQELCDYNPTKIVEAEKVAIEAINARIELWDKVNLLLAPDVFG